MSRKRPAGITFTLPRKHMGVVDTYGNLRDLWVFQEKRFKEWMFELKPREHLFLVNMSGVEYDEVIELFYRQGPKVAFEVIFKEKHPIFVRQPLLYRFLGAARKLFNFYLNKVLCML